MMTTRPVTSELSEFDDLLREWGFDPNKYMILDNTIRVSTWDMNLGKGEIQQAWAYKAQIVAKDLVLDTKDYAKLNSWIQSYKRKPKPKVKQPKSTFFVAISDLQ